MYNKSKVKSIKNKGKILNLLKNGKVFNTKNLKFHYIQENNLDSQIEYLISIPKKNIKLAVTRNYLKRIIRNIISSKKNRLTKLRTKTIFIIVFINNCKIKYSKLEKEILTFSRRIE